MTHLAIVGATGAVGQEILTVLDRRRFPVRSLRCFASANSIGKSLIFRGEKILIETLQPGCFQGVELAFFCAGRKISEDFAMQAVAEGAAVIDNSSFFRLHDHVPLVIPEVNPEALKNHQGIIANPNCTTAIMLMPLAPLHRRYGIKRIVASTYQAASGAGYRAMQELKQETFAHCQNTPFERSVFPHPYAFNLFSHNSPLLENGYNEEEMKMVYETRKILNDATINISASCVRVPVLRAHSESLNVEFHRPIDINAIRKILNETPGVSVLEDWKNNRFPMPSDATGQDEVFCGKIRADLSQPNTLELWVVGDQLLKGAALNAVQIAELLTHG
jgi:aspartate-semialdehyde dehydrogenase